MLEDIIKLVQNGRLDEARFRCIELHKTNRNNLDILLILAEIYARAGDVNSAKASYRKAIKIKPDSAKTHNALAMLLHNQGNYAKAELSYHRSLKLVSNQPATCFNYAAVLQELNKLDEAKNQYQKAIELQPDYAKAHANLAYILRKQNSHNEAINHYLKALIIEPKIPEIHHNTGLTYLQLGDIKKAESHQVEALKLNPDYVDAHCAIGNINILNRNFSKSMTSYNHALKLDRQHIDSICGLARCYTELGAHDEALKQFELALKIQPDNHQNRLALGSTYLDLGKTTEALECSHYVLKKSPDNIKAITLTANCHEKAGSPEKAYEVIKPYLDINISRPYITICYANISKKIGHQKQAVKFLEKILSNSKKLDKKEKYQLNFTLGKILDDLNKYDEAFIHYKIANDLRRPEYDANTHTVFIDNLINIVDHEFMSNMPRSSIHTDQPVFIIGMPRSGTSLVEQILASHPHIYGAGELNNINHLAQTLNTRSASKSQYPFCLKSVNKDSLNIFAQEYLDYVKEISAGEIRTTDKMPGNFIHLGLIELLFPNAYVIHCKRNPLDTCLSCYFQDFPAEHPYIYNLSDLANYYNNYERLMTHWNKTLNLKIMDVQYEELVNNQANVSKQLVEFCGLEWEDKCLDFHNNDRFVWTASYDQVRQPMYNKSVNRWKNYKDHLQPLIESINSNHIF